MAQRIVIDPVTRIEGHAKITIYLDDAGEVADARFHVTEFRGFERFCEGRPFFEMAGLSARICGICPVSHLMASAKAGDQILAVDHPAGRGEAAPADEPGPDRPVARPELLPPQRPRLDARLGQRPGEAQRLRPDRGRPDLARGGIRLRQFGQEMIEALGGKKIHPAWGVPGGVRDALSARSAATTCKAGCPRRGRRRWRPWRGSKACSTASRRRREPSATSRRCSWVLIGPDGDWEHYDGSSASWTPKARSSRTGSRPCATPSSLARRSNRIRT